MLYGPHGAPDFFTPEDIETFFSTAWKVHYNSDRTGVRLIGPKPAWARKDGGEAGLHPSNIHDNAYAVGTVDFTGDMPVILGPDGPSLGGFVCPATIVQAELWKIGQLKPGDLVRFHPLSLGQATRMERELDAAIGTLTGALPGLPAEPARGDPVLRPRAVVAYRADGDRYLLVEYGPNVLDLNLRFRVHALEEQLRKRRAAGHYSTSRPACARCIFTTTRAACAARRCSRAWTPASERIPGPRRHRRALAHRAPAALLGRPGHAARHPQIHAGVRPDAPWCPSNIEFIRRINGLPSIDDVREIVFDASYLVLGLGDVYLGAPVATPVDPRHRLVTTKYNPARTWTPENAVGIGGAYLCVYGMEGPGGYQFVGRTVQMWNTYRSTREFEPGTPWLLRFFDQIRLLPGDRRRAARNPRRVSARRLSAAHRAAGVPPEGLPRLPALHRERSRGIQAAPAGGLRGGARALGRGGRGPVPGGRRATMGSPRCRWTRGAGRLPRGLLTGHGERLEHRGGSRPARGGRTEADGAGSHEDGNRRGGAQRRESLKS